MAMPVLFALTFEILTTKYLVYFKNHFRITAEHIFYDKQSNLSGLVAFFVY